MKNIVKNYIIKDIWFYVLSLLSIGLIVAGFVVPPLGVIDPSVLTAVGEMLAFGALGVALRVINEHTQASITKGDMEINIGGDNDESNQEAK